MQWIAPSERGTGTETLESRLWAAADADALRNLFSTLALATRVTEVARLGSATHDLSVATTIGTCR
jgi:hypothetical protein